MSNNNQNKNIKKIYDVYYLINKHLPITSASDVPLDFITKEIEKVYNINVKSIERISENKCWYFMEKRFAKGEKRVSYFW
jgi:hypothetical protein